MTELLLWVLLTAGTLAAGTVMVWAVRRVIDELLCRRRRPPVIATLDDLRPYRGAIVTSDGARLVVVRTVLRQGGERTATIDLVDERDLPRRPS